jgi:chemotaxis protein CheZ
VQRKHFRIEQMHAARRATPLAARAPVASPAPAAPTADGDMGTLVRELVALRGAIAHNTHELARLLNEGQERRMTRAAHELGAAVEVMETSTDKILKSAEIIDDNAKTLGSSLKSDYESSLALDIQDQLTAIYEACNFQDIAGQRIGKVVGTLGQIDAALTRMLVHCQSLLGGEAVPVTSTPTPQHSGLLNGPRLDGDLGHASQCEIDALFG